jgi:hypothetical protein
LQTGVTGNALDFSFQSYSDIPRVLEDFSASCAGAATINPENCPLAAASAQSNDSANDILNRIYYIFSNLSSQPFVLNPDPNGTIYTFESSATDIVAHLAIPSLWNFVAQRLLDMETAIHANSNQFSRRPVPLNFSSFNRRDLFSNNFVPQAVGCLDANYSDISTPNQFLEYLSQNLNQNALIGFQGIQAATCLNWPNLGSHDVQAYRASFPSSLKTPILIIAEVDDPLNAYSGVLATFDYIGAHNTRLLTHDGIGHGWYLSPNNCTLNGIKEFYRNGEVRSNI